MSLAAALPAGVQVFERGWLSSNNILLTDAERATLVDSGYVAHATQTVALVSHALGARALDELVNTHLHSDHCGGNAALQAHYPQLRTRIPPGLAEPAWALVFALLGAGMLGTLGLIAGLWAEKFDQVAAFQNFLIMPLTFLSGVFYSVHSLPAFWQAVSHLNPFFYMIDGFRRGFFGASDVSPWISLAVVGTSFVVLASIALRLLTTGYKIRS